MECCKILEARSVGILQAFLLGESVALCEH